MGWLFIPKAAFVGWVRRGGDFGIKAIAFIPRRSPPKPAFVAFVGWVRRGDNFGIKAIAFIPRRRPTKTVVRYGWNRG